MVRQYALVWRRIQRAQCRVVGAEALAAPLLHKRGGARPRHHDGAVLLHALAHREWTSGQPVAQIPAHLRLSSDQHYVLALAGPLCTVRLRAKGREGGGPAFGELPLACSVHAVASCRRVHFRRRLPRWRSRERDAPERGDYARGRPARLHRRSVPLHARRRGAVRSHRDLAVGRHGHAVDTPPPSLAPSIQIPRGSANYY
mmetsp:Transcript_6927/g.17902  ORF Transcript_6927/g.17902 Transcript_6927/m.17902 type:complete len:201 (-) Transcript_6927:114-716(-)